ncbi:MAG: TRAP transporter small permease [Deltaproteobacteria bacterium]|nr:TRAP transporter small permease [Deltaproteobacteria bacterium]
MKFFSAADRVFDIIIKYLCYLAAAMLVLMALAISSDVIMRYAVNTPLKWVFEATEYALLFITFLAATWVLQKDEHVRLDAALNALGPKVRAIVEALTSFVMAVVCLVITWSSAHYTIYLFQNHITIQKYYTIPEFAVFFIVPVGFFLLFIQSLKRIYQYIGQSRRR